MPIKFLYTAFLFHPVNRIRIMKPMSYPTISFNDVMNNTQGARGKALQHNLDVDLYKQFSSYIL